MMKTKLILQKTLIAGCMIISMSFCNNVVADDHMPPGRWWENPKIASELQLTEKQKQDLDTIFKRQRVEMLDMRSNQEKSRYKLEDIMEANTLDRNAAKAEFKNLQAMRTQFAEKRFDFLLDVRETLGAEKFKLLKNFFKEQMPRRFAGRDGYKDGLDDEPGQPPLRRK